MQYGDALKIIGGLSNVSKMPWYSWSISASDCITGSSMRDLPGSVCNSCYALKGNYLFSNVKSAHLRRKAALDHPDFVEAFALVLNTLYARQRRTRRENRFRWFDSGDLQSLDMLRKINRIAELTPDIVHWLPTRELPIVREFLTYDGVFAPNLTVRISAPIVGVVLKSHPFGLPTAMVGVQESPNLHQCPALRLQNNQCLACNACWLQDIDVNYPVH